MWAWGLGINTPPAKKRHIYRLRPSRCHGGGERRQRPQECRVALWFPAKRHCLHVFGARWQQWRRLNAPRKPVKALLVRSDASRQEVDGSNIHPRWRNQGGTLCRYLRARSTAAVMSRSLHKIKAQTRKTNHNYTRSIEPIKGQQERSPGFLPINDLLPTVYGLIFLLPLVSVRLVHRKMKLQMTKYRIV